MSGLMTQVNLLPTYNRHPMKIYIDGLVQERRNRSATELVLVL